MSSKIIHRILFNLRTVLFPERCAACGKFSKLPYICADCRDLLEPIPENFCKKCGMPEDNCMCDYYFYYFDGIICPFLNRGTAKQAVYNIKFASNPNAAKFFGEKIAESFRKAFPYEKIDYVSFVPMRKSAKHARGYNQAEKLAEYSAKNINIKCLGLLKQKNKKAVQHKAKSVDERFQNIFEKYSVKGKSDLKNKNILIIDDVKTTGATLSECSRQLKLKGANKVFCSAAVITCNDE